MNIPRIKREVDLAFRRVDERVKLIRTYLYKRLLADAEELPWQDLLDRIDPELERESDEMDLRRARLYKARRGRKNLVW
jgi:hypothetical protein